MQTKNSSILWLSLAIWSLFLIPWLFVNGIFVDGLYYGTIARNWYFEQDGLWNFYVTKTQFHPFYSHPPLAFWLQGFLFSLIGDVWYCDRLYSLVMFTLSAVALLRIWSLFFKSCQWLPLLCWLLLPTVTWSFSNNILENTVTAFSSWAVYWVLSTHKTTQKAALKLIISGIFIFLAIMTKGPVAAFPLAIPFILPLFYKRKLTLLFGLEVSLPILVVVFLFLILFCLDSNALAYFKAYWQLQVMGSLSGESTVTSSRFFILWKLVEELLLLTAITILLILVYKIKFRQNFLTKESRTKAWLFLSIALFSSLPILISPKQMGFYLLPSTPFWALTAAVFLIAVLEKQLPEISDFRNKLVATLSLLLFVIALSLAVFNYKKSFVRDKDILFAISEITDSMPKHDTIGISYTLDREWYLYGYFYRYAYISLQATTKPEYKYYLIKQGEKMPFDDYDEISLHQAVAKLYRLYKKH